MGWKDIRAITMDVDGVMTDGGLIAYDSHEMVRVFNAKDSFAIRLAQMRGLRVAVFSGGETEGVRNRLITCDIPEDDIHLGCRGKIRPFEDFCRKYALRHSEVLYIGDDVPDVPVLKLAGIGAVPADAAKDAQYVADYICDQPGGKGCVREVIEIVMRKQGLWTFADDDYFKIF